MNSKRMPRGAIPTPRSELAAADPYRNESETEVFFPNGQFPTPNYALAAAQPYRPSGVSPASFLSWPIEIAIRGDDVEGNSNWIEEAFAKACASPKVRIPTDAVQLAVRECGSSNFARFMQTRGFQVGSITYLDGPFYSVDWTNSVVLNGAIANVGPVKIGVATANLTSWPHGQVTAGRNGWAIYGLPLGQPQDHCASLCGYGTLTALSALFKQNNVNAGVPQGMPTDLCYAMFIGDSIGIIDQQSLLNITGEAWVRNPTTVVEHLNR